MSQKRSPSAQKAMDKAAALEHIAKLRTGEPAYAVSLHIVPMVIAVLGKDEALIVTRNFNNQTVTMRLAGYTFT